MNADALAALLELVHQAGQATLPFWRQDVAVTRKADDSPVTAADMAAHHILAAGLPQILDIPLSNLFRIKVANASLTRVEYAEQGEEFLGQLIFHAGSLQH